MILCSVCGNITIARRAIHSLRNDMLDKAQVEIPVSLSGVFCLEVFMDSSSGVWCNLHGKMYVIFHNHRLTCNAKNDTIKRILKMLT